MNPIEWYGELKGEISIIMDAPKVIILLLVLTAIITYCLSRWRYVGIIESLREQINTVKENLKIKEEEIENFKNSSLKLKESSGIATTTIATENPTESFKELYLNELKIQAQRWVDRHPEAKIERIVLYRYASHFQKHLKGNIPTKYVVVFETPKNTNTDELESDTEYCQTVKDGYKELMCADFNGVYKNPPLDDDFKYEWIFFVKKPPKELPIGVMFNEPFWVLYP